MKKPFLNSVGGNALVSVMMATGLLGIVAMTMTRMQVFSFKAQKKVENDSARDRIRNVITERISCEQTLAGLSPGECNGADGASAVIALKDKSGETFASGAGNATKIGDFAIRAICNKSAKEIVVRVGMSKSNVPLGEAPGSSIFIKDPLTDKLLDWGHPKNMLYPVGAGLCKSHFGGSSSTTCDAATEGNTRYNPASKQLEFCDGTSWKIPGKPDFVIAAQYYQEETGTVACGTTTPTSTNAGDSNQATCRRVFNTLLSNTGGYGSISGGNLTLDPGTYHCHLTAVGYQSEHIRTRFQEVGGKGLVFYGDQQLSEDHNQYTSVSSSLIAQFSLASSTTFEVHHWVRNQGLHDGGPLMRKWPGYQAIISCMRWP